MTLYIHCLEYIVLLFVLRCQCQEPNKVIFVSLDGFRHDYIEKALAEGRNVSSFQKLWSDGLRATVQNVMVTLTFPSHYSMTTGRYTENHGLVGNQFYDPKIKEKYKYTDKKDAMDNRFYEYRHAEPLWITNERHGHRSGVFYWPGNDARNFDRMPFATYGLYSDAADLHYRIDRVMDWITRPEFNLVFLYYNQPDHSGHSYGPDSPEVMDAMEEVNEGIGYLMQRLENHEATKGKVNLIIGSDHGMMTVYPDDPEKVASVNEVLKANEDYYADASPATLGFWPNKKTEDQIYKALNVEKITSKAKLYKKDEIPDEYHMKNNYRIAPIYLIANPNVLISTRDDPYTNLNGMHGYDNKLDEMHPIMFAAGPDIKQMPANQIQQFHQVDYYPFICGLLRLDQPNTIDGEIKRTTQFMKNPPDDNWLDEFQKLAGAAKPEPN